MNAVVDDFKAALLTAIEECRALGYNPQRFAAMLEAHDAVHLARTMVATADLHDGFLEVINRGRPDLTMESIMLEARFANLFNQRELAAAKWRLDQALNP